MLAEIIELGGLVHGLIYLIVIGLLFWLVTWLIDWIGVPEPFRKVILVVLGLVAFIVLANFLLSLIGGGFVAW